MFGRKQAADPKAVPVGIDRSTFFLTTIPQEVRACVPLLHELETEVANTLIEQLSECMQSSSGLDVNAVLQLNTLFKAKYFSYLADAKASTVVTGLYTLIQTCIQSKVRPRQVETDLSRMNVPVHVVSAVMTALRRARPQLESAALSSRLRCPTVTKFRWRIDVTMSTGLLSKVMRPSIMMQLCLSSGIIKTFEVSIEQFNQLRYSVAKVLQEMQRVERHPILRIINEDERKDALERCK
jgi:COMM domain containing 5